jgi:hypothetical protein
LKCKKKYEIQIEKELRGICHNWWLSYLSINYCLFMIYAVMVNGVMLKGVVVNGIMVNSVMLNGVMVNRVMV